MEDFAIRGVDSVRIAHCERPAGANGDAPVANTTVSAGTVELFQKVLADRVAGEQALLIRDTRDFWFFEQLRIEPHALERNSSYRNDTAQPFDPGHAGIDPVPQTRREPTLQLSPVSESQRTVTKIGTPTAAPKRPTGREGFADLPPAMGGELGSLVVGKLVFHFISLIQRA
jgi:hypothetical protein